MRAGLFPCSVTLALGLMAAGCAARPAYVFRPTETPNLTRENRAVARYVVPRALPRGELFVTSDGIAAAASENESRLHVRITVFNVAGEAPWAVDIRDQLVTLPGGPQIHASSVKTDAHGAPILTIIPGERIAMDLYFDLPEGWASGDGMPTFDFIWQVATDKKLAAGTVPFGRFPAETRSGQATVATATTSSVF